jgi:hypothetical protein
MKNTGPSIRSALGASGLLLIFSFFFPYWEALVATSSQADALQLSIYVSHASGPLLERLPAPDDLLRLVNSTTAAAGLALTLLALAIAFARRPWALLLCLPILMLPAVVGADASEFLAASAGVLPDLPGKLATRLGTGAFIAWGAAALLIGAALRELCKFGAARLPGWHQKG